MQHLDEGTIHAWLDGALSSDEAAEVEQHVRECAECSTAVAEARGMIAGAARIVSMLDVVPGGVIPRTAPVVAKPRSMWRTLHLTPLRASIAAALMIGVASMFAIKHEQTGTPVREVAIDTPAPVSAPAPFAVAEPIAPPPARREEKTRSKPVVEKQTGQAQELEATEVPQVAALAAPRVPAPDSVRAKAASVDSFASQRQQAQKASYSAASAAAGASLAREAARQSVMAPTAAVLRDAEQTFESCYQVSVDSSAARFIPERFSLENNGVVRAVMADGRVDSVITRASWQKAGSSVAMVNWVPDRSVRLMLVGTGSGYLTVPNEPQRSVRVAVVPCAR